MTNKDNQHRQTDFGFKKVAEEDKARQVREVFDSVAPKYDLMNDVLSFGMHRLWKRYAVYKADESPLILQQKEMTGKNLEPGGKRFPCACLAHGKTDCFDPANSIQIILCSRPYPHELHLASIYS